MSNRGIHAVLRTARREELNSLWLIAETVEKQLNWRRSKEQKLRKKFLSHKFLFEFYHSTLNSAAVTFWCLRFLLEFSWSTLNGAAVTFKSLRWQNATAADTRWNRKIQTHSKQWLWYFSNFQPNMVSNNQYKKRVINIIIN